MKEHNDSPEHPGAWLGKGINMTLTAGMEKWHVLLHRSLNKFGAGKQQATHKPVTEPFRPLQCGCLGIYCALGECLPGALPLYEVSYL